MKLFLGLSLSILTVIGLAGCNNGDEGLAGGPPELAEEVVELIVTPKTSSIPIGFSQALKAEALLSEGQVIDVTEREEVFWESSDETIATIDTNGLATGKAEGIVIITISGQSNGQAFSDTAKLEVTNTIVTSLKVTPATATVPAGFEQSYTALATLSNGQTLDVTDNAALNWSSSDTATATIDNEPGVATGEAVGMVMITASGEANETEFSATAELEVTNAIVMSLDISPVTSTIAVDLEQPYTALATFDDGDELDVTNHAALNWVSSDTTIATIEETPGIATGKNVGTTTITVSGTANNTEFSAAAELNVQDVVIMSLEVIPETTTVGVGFSRSYTALATLSDDEIVNVTNNAALSWRSSNTEVAAIESQTGVVTGETMGTVTITASGIAHDTEFSGTSELTVDSSVPNVVSWGNREDDILPVLGALFDVTSISSTHAAFAAIKGDGSVVTWGASSNGGDSSLVQSELVNVSSISPNSFAFAALKDDGTIITWGASSNGGDSSLVQDELVNIISIVGSEGAFAAIKGDGSVVTWGDINTGGDSSLVQDELVNIISIVGSEGAFAAIKGDGSVVTWGASSNGGDSSLVQSELVNVSSISANDFAFAALKDDGTIITWGASSNGGDSSLVQDELVDITAVSSTRGAFAAITEDGNVVTWGNPNMGSDSDSVEGLVNVNSITGNIDSFAALKDDRTVVTWGGTDGGDSSEVQDDLTDIISIFKTGAAFAALKDDGTVVTWGWEEFGGDSSSVKDELVNVIIITNSTLNNTFVAIKQIE